MIERPGSNASSGIGMPRRGIRRDGLGDAERELLDRRGVVGRGVGDAESAAEVELGQRRDPRELGVRGEQALGRLREAGGVEDLRADVAVQPEEVERPVRADARDDVDGAARA